jgi:hypothetical protein
MAKRSIGVGASLTDEKRGHIDTVVSLLELVADGQIPAASALEKWHGIGRERDSLIAAAWHDLSHFAADDDIRRRDDAYHLYQRKLLQEKASRIREKYS